MKILLITQYYYPVKGAAAKRTGKFASFLSEAGHDVEVLTGMPSYPTGKLDKKYRWKLWVHEIIDHIKVTRTYEFPASTQDSTIKRILNMLSFAQSASIFALFHKKYDCVIVSSPSFLSGTAGLWARHKKTKFYFDIRDLWPDSAIQLGLLKEDSFFTNQLKKMEQNFYKHSEVIFTATPGIKKHLEDEGIGSHKIEVILNSVDTSLFNPQPTNRQQFDFNDSDFICGYVGNISRIYDLETVLEAANILKHEPNIKFWIIGEGENKLKLEKKAKNKTLNNIFFHQEVGLSELPPMVNVFDLGLAPIADIGVSQESFPSKTCEYLACAKPVVASISGDLKKYIEESNAGLTYASKDAQGLADIILKLYHNQELIKTMGQNARRLAFDVFSDDIIKQKLKNIFS